jgi:hypothetical protein
MDETPNPSEPPIPANARWAKTVLWLGVLFIIALNGALVFKSCVEAPGKVIDKAGAALERVAAAFNRGTITTSFVSYATSVTNSLHLEFATLKQMEIFSRQEKTSTGFGYIPLPEVVVEARAPVEFTYYLDLEGPWRIEVKDQFVHVFAPPIKFNKPSVDASAIQYEVRKGLLKTSEAQERLKRSITSLVTLRAQENIPLVRETGRSQAEKFIETWLLKSFADGKQYAIKVHFADESSGSSPKH